MLIMADTADTCVTESKITSKAIPPTQKREREYKTRKMQPSITVYILYIPSLTEKGIVTTP